jgi:hypothetical protein
MPSFVVLVFALSFAPLLVLTQPHTINVATFFSLTYAGQVDTAGVSRETAFIAAVQDINNNARYFIIKVIL